MRVQEQTTLSTSAGASGISLHFGVETRIVLHPAPAGSGVAFRRTDLQGENGAPRPAGETTVRARPQSLADTRLGVRLENAAGVSVMTVEHLMAAFALAGVDNALVEIDGPEIPAFDGSAAPILRLIAQAGLSPLGAAREAFEASAVLRIEDGDRFIELRPACDRRIAISIDFPDAAIGRQSVEFSLDDGAAAARAAAARTFCRLEDVEAMRAAGFARGGSLDNAVVVDGARLLNPGGLRDPEEFALHKALDLIGDLYLLGAPLYGRIRAHKPGHDLNTRLVRRIAADPACARRRAVAADGEAARATA